MVKIQLINPIDGGGPREIDLAIQEKSSMLEIKKQIHSLTGIPIHDQKVMLAGIGSMVLFDKRDSSIGYSSCGSTNSLAFCFDEASEKK